MYRHRKDQDSRCQKGLSGLTTCPTPRAGTAPCGQVIPEPEVPQWEKRAERGHPAAQTLGIALREPCAGLTPQRLQGNPTETKKEGAASNNQHAGDGCRCSQRQEPESGVPTSSVAHPQNHVGGAVSPWRSAGRWAALAQAGELSHCPSRCSVWLGPHRTGRAGVNTRGCRAQPRSRPQVDRWS